LATRVPTVWGHPIKLEQYEEITQLYPIFLAFLNWWNTDMVTVKAES